MSHFQKINVEKICAGHYMVETSIGKFSVAKHDGEWVKRLDCDRKGAYKTKKEAMDSIRWDVRDAHADGVVR